ncbi:MAG: hypothetical protein QM756_22890 [Polyangiaceae bacterium]
MATRLRSLRGILGKIDRRADARVVAALLRTSALTLADFRDHEKVEAAAKKLEQALSERYPDLLPLQVNVDWEKAHGAGRIVVRFRPGAATRPAILDWELAESAEYQELLSIWEDVRSSAPCRTACVWVRVSRSKCPIPRRSSPSSPSAGARACRSPATKASVK